MNNFNINYNYDSKQMTFNTRLSQKNQRQVTSSPTNCVDIQCYGEISGVILHLFNHSMFYLTEAEEIYSCLIQIVMGVVQIHLEKITAQRSLFDVSLSYFAINTTNCWYISSYC